MAKETTDILHVNGQGFFNKNPEAGRLAEYCHVSIGVTETNEARSGSLFVAGGKDGISYLYAPPSPAYIEDVTRKDDGTIVTKFACRVTTRKANGKVDLQNVEAKCELTVRGETASDLADNGSFAFVAKYTDAQGVTKVITDVPMTNSDATHALIVS